MNSVGEIFEFLNELAPTTLKMDFDNVGLLVGDKEAAVYNCLVALDITDDVISEAQKLNCQLIVSHHPLIFSGLKSVTADNLTGRKIIKLLSSGISAVCMHTNLDIAKGGVNDALMQSLGAVQETYLEASDTPGEGCGRIGTLPHERDFYDFLDFCKSELCAGGLRYHYAGRTVKKLAVMGGSGGSALSLAAAAGCDTYVTADVKYNTFLDAKELGINLIDAGHFCTENVIVPVIAEKLSQRFCDIGVSISAVHKQTEQFF